MVFTTESPPAQVHWSSRELELAGAARPIRETTGQFLCASLFPHAISVQSGQTVSETELHVPEESAQVSPLIDWLIEFSHKLMSKIQPVVTR